MLSHKQGTVLKEAIGQAYVPRNTRLDWSPPETPECPRCGEPGEMSVYNTGDGWHVFWDCECEWLANNDRSFIGEDGWPFVGDIASDLDWQAAGFTVV